MRSGPYSSISRSFCSSSATSDLMRCMVSSWLSDGEDHIGRASTRNHKLPPYADLRPTFDPRFRIEDLVEKRRDVLRYARSLPRGPRRNQLRQTAASLRTLFNNNGCLSNRDSNLGGFGFKLSLWRFTFLNYTKSTKYEALEKKCRLQA